MGVGNWTYYTPKRHPVLVLVGIRSLHTARCWAHVSSPRDAAGSHEPGLEGRWKSHSLMRHGRRIMQVRFPVNPGDPEGESNGQLDSRSVSGQAG